MRILIVDDEINIRSLMVRYMKTEDIEGVGAENAYSAQRLLREQPYDGILVDLKMPGMDGMEFVRWVRDEGFRMPVIMMSAHGDITDAVNAMKHGVQDYIVKPFDPAEVIIKLKNLVEAQNFRTLQEMEERLPQGRAFIGESVQIRRIKDLIGRIAATNSSVLITGESGTGRKWSPGPSMSRARSLPVRSSPSTSEVFRRTCLSRSSSDTRKAPSRVPWAARAACSNWPTAEHCSWMRSETCRMPCR